MKDVKRNPIRYRSYRLGIDVNIDYLDEILTDTDLQPDQQLAFYRAVRADPDDEELGLCELAKSWGGWPVGSPVLVGLTGRGLPFWVFDRAEVMRRARVNPAR